MNFINSGCRTRMLLMAAAVAAVAAGLHPSALAQSESGVDLTTADNADERLFVIYAVRYHLEQAKDFGSGDLATELTEMPRRLREPRRRLVRLKVHVQQQKLDPELAQCCQEVIDLIDATDTVLSRISALYRQVRTAAARNDSAAAARGFETGLETAGAAERSGASGGDAAAVGLLAGLISGAVEADQRHQELKDASVARFTEYRTAWLNSIQLHLARIQGLAAALAKRHGWAVKETGLADGKVGPADMPRNPFTQVEAALVAGERAATPLELLKAAFQCKQAVRLVPRGALYDDYRLLCLEAAARLTERVAFWRIRHQGLENGARLWEGQEAARLLEACLKFTHDPTGAYRARKAWMLAADGKLDDAVKLAGQVVPLRNGDQDFAYKMACVLSAAGRTDLAFQWFRHAVAALGYNQMRRARQSPSLAAMRKAKAAEFAELLRVKFAWHIDFGVFNDDIWLTNQSPFALTNVKLQVKLVQGGRVWNRELTVARLDPGQRRKWVDVVSIPDSWIDRKQSIVTINCDQQ